MDKRTKVTLSDEAILQRLRRYCTFRERSVKEVKKKLLKYGVLEEYILSILENLQIEGFLNERRYVSAFAGGKFRSKKWGKRKIEMELKKQGISDELLEKGLNEITNEDYFSTLDKLLMKKWKQLKLRAGNTENPEYGFFTPEMQKLMNYAMQKGYESEIIINRFKFLRLQ